MLPQICYASATPRQGKSSNINDLYGLEETLTVSARKQIEKPPSGGFSICCIAEMRKPPAWPPREIRRRRAYLRSGGLPEVSESHRLRQFQELPCRELFFASS